MFYNSSHRSKVEVKQEPLSPLMLEETTHRVEKMITKSHVNTRFKAKLLKTESTEVAAELTQLKKTENGDTKGGGEEEEEDDDVESLVKQNFTKEFFMLYENLNQRDKSLITTQVDTLHANNNKTEVESMDHTSNQDDFSSSVCDNVVKMLNNELSLSNLEAQNTPLHVLLDTTDIIDYLQTQGSL